MQADLITTAADQSFGGVRVKNFKALYTAKDTLARTGAIPKDPGALRSLVGPRRELRHRFQRCGADPGRLQDLARPLFRPGQWLDRPLHQPRDDAVLGWDGDAPEHPLQAVRCGLLRADSVSLPL